MIAIIVVVCIVIQTVNVIYAIYKYDHPNDTSNDYKMLVGVIINIGVASLNTISVLVMAKALLNFR